jgi:hypothetical protein
MAITAKADFDPAGKSFKQRLEAFLAFSQKEYGVPIGQDHGRTPQWAQRMHICHMFLYNAFAHNKPKFTEKGKGTIAWDHISDPKVEWALISFKELLRTADGGVPEKTGPSWKPGKQPDLEKTKENMSDVLIAGGCAQGGKAMIACGITPCGEPCCCGTGRSNHLDGRAADLKLADLNLLTNKLKAKNAGSLDDVLYKFGLHRPMLHHKHPEAWHVEATSSTSIHPSRPPAEHRKKHEQLKFRDQLLPSPLHPHFYA